MFRWNIVSIYLFILFCFFICVPSIPLPFLYFPPVSHVFFHLTMASYLNWSNGIRLLLWIFAISFSYHSFLNFLRFELFSHFHFHLSVVVYPLCVYPWLPSLFIPFVFIFFNFHLVLCLFSLKYYCSCSVMYFSWFNSPFSQFLFMFFTYHPLPMPVFT